jgi:hypothetical protein
VVNPITILKITIFISWTFQPYPDDRKIISFTLWVFNIAMENGPFIDGLPMVYLLIS